MKPGIVPFLLYVSTSSSKRRMAYISKYRLFRSLVSRDMLPPQERKLFWTVTADRQGLLIQTRAIEFLRPETASFLLNEVSYKMYIHVVKKKFVTTLWTCGLLAANEGL
jgi:hypothetical protein